MKDLLTYIVKSILNSEEVSIDEEISDSGTTILTIKVPSLEYGKIIGKKGRIINAIRKMVNLVASKEGKRAVIKLAEENQGEKGLNLAPAGTEDPLAEEVVNI